ncbi:UvrD-helicase domain-containing protein [Piscinibacter terrae]|uniref:DNA 3'-5' helicase n=1 Tax=Piscinibacter terrae TaxID=2496871 RepID=A0A3N7JLA7_9BURK|nr:UvrD-helicase domain-containing protein [Albitalea terrae]RQP22069.1 DNA helicase UvrD [Albitalea terrae]
MTGAAYQIDGRLASREAFYAAACDPRRSVIVEACAGAGKTWMLVSRILRALLDGAMPQEILAITFTRKAAGEMRARLDEWLADFGSPECDDARRQRELMARGMSLAEATSAAPLLADLHERLLATGRSVEVRTFHAWFSQLLRAAPLELLNELGLQPDMDLLEDVADHRGEVYRRFHAAVIADEVLHEDFRALVLSRGRSQLRKWLDAAWARRIDIELADQGGVLEDSVKSAAEQWPSYAGLPHPSHRVLMPDARAMLAAVAATLGAHKSATCKKQAVVLEQALGLDDPPQSLDGVRAALFTGKGELRKALADVPGVSEVAGLIEDIDRACRQQSAHDEHLRMVRLSRTLFAEYAAYKRSRGLADMNDLERCALALLRDATLSAWVQERLDARVRHLLIDEFQDTSPLQWHALHAWLAGYAGAGGGTSGYRPLGVFIVGDPKQSIYRFRGAEPKVFAAARDFLLQGLGGTVLTCDHTRRNSPEVLQALNGVFRALQDQARFEGFREHTTESVPHGGPGALALPEVMRPQKEKPAEDDAPLAWRDSLTQPRIEAEELLRQQEARLVAAAVDELIDSGMAPGDIQVLCRKRESLRLAADELSRLHIPFAAPEAFDLLDAPEARDIVALLDVLASPQHKLSLAHALRSPLFGASDDDLVRLARQAVNHGDWWRALRESPEASPALDRARKLLQRWANVAQQLPPHDLLDIVVAEGELRERLAAAVPAERRPAALNAVDAVLNQALTLDGARYATPYNFVRALKRRSLKVPAALQPDAVQLLTVHGAKGLEAEVVFIMDADPTPKNAETATLLVDWPVEAESPQACAFVYSEGQCPPSLLPVLAREREAREREELNSLYVAMTRARQRLVFSATQPHRPPEQPSWWQLLQPVAQPMPATQAHEPHAAQQRPIVLPVLPNWTDAPERPAVPARATAEDSMVSLLGKAVHRTLEWAGAQGPLADDADHFDHLADAAAREFQSDGRQVRRLAGRIWRSPDCARFFRGPQLHWSGNEVPVGEGETELRIDRLVALEAAGRRQWWVLDYKLNQSPAELPQYRDQLLRYRRIVQSLQPADEVRCAFITGAGELVELTP